MKRAGGWIGDVAGDATGHNSLRMQFGATPPFPIPAFIVFVIVSVRRLRRERIGVPVDRLVGKEAA